jgi:hypothetical protein
MTKKRKARRRVNTSKRKRSGKTPARRHTDEEEKGMEAYRDGDEKKREKQQAERETTDSSACGNATAAGVTFQASVGAVFAVQMLTESFWR